DARADVVLLEALRRRCGERWPGRLIMEGLDEPASVGDPTGEWVYIADPVDGTRPWLPRKRSAWDLFGAARGARPPGGRRGGGACRGRRPAGPGGVGGHRGSGLRRGRRPQWHHSAARRPAQEPGRG